MRKRVKCRHGNSLTSTRSLSPPPTTPTLSEPHPPPPPPNLLPRLRRFCAVSNHVTYVHVCCVWQALYAGLTGRRASWKVALDRLEKLFSGGGDGVAGGKAVVVVVDELDRLVTKTQTVRPPTSPPHTKRTNSTYTTITSSLPPLKSLPPPQVLYNLFDWPTRPDARITVVGIANTMDLPDRLLQRIVRRMGLKRCTFRPYTRPQIVSILEHRLEGVATVDANAIKKVAMKVGAQPKRGMERDGLAWDGMRWNGMRGDGMGWDGMGWETHLYDRVMTCLFACPPGGVCVWGCAEGAGVVQTSC